MAKAFIDRPVDYTITLEMSPVEAAYVLAVVGTSRENSDVPSALLHARADITAALGATEPRLMDYGAFVGRSSVIERAGENAQL